MNKDLIRPGMFAEPIAADSMRMCYDEYNDAILTLGLRPDFVFIGDSITQFWDLPLFFGREKLLINRGIGGDVPRYILRRFAADVLQLHPAYCVLMAGTNYANEMMDNPWFGMKGKPFDEVVEMTVRDLTAILSCAEEAGQPMIFGTIPPAIVPPADRRNEMILQVNAAMKAYCGERGIIVVDYHAALLDEASGRMKPDYTTDGIHPDARGFAVMAATLRETLEKEGIEI